MLCKQGNVGIRMQAPVSAMNLQGWPPSSAPPASSLWPCPATCFGQVRSANLLVRSPRRRTVLPAACWFTSSTGPQLLLASQEGKLTTAVLSKVKRQSGAASIMLKIYAVLALLLLQAAACLGQAVAPPAGAPSGGCTLSVTGQVSASAAAGLP